MECVEQLRRLCLEKASHIRQQGLLQVLASVTAPDAVPLIIGLLRDDDEVIQQKAAESLGRIGELEAVVPLLYMLRNPWGAARIEAAEALGKLRDARAVERTNYAVAKDDIPTVVFASSRGFFPMKEPFLFNPDCAELNIPMRELEKIVIDSAGYHFDLVERFITYAINHIGQAYLKKYVIVPIYGDPEKLHLNLRNTFENVCKSVEVHEE